MNIIAALDDRNLLGASIRAAESWKPAGVAGGHFRTN
jgi:hypothetical protein